MINHSDPQSCKSEHVVVVFIHGTIFAYPSVENAQKSFWDTSSDKSFLGRYFKNVRFTGLYKCQPIDEKGLVPIDLREEKRSFEVKKLIASKYRNIYQKSLGDKNVSFHLYTFGWSGRLSRWEREKAAFNLYEQLKQEIIRLQKKHSTENIKIEIVAHSHGGNVALNLAQVEEKGGSNLCIDRLVLLGTPIQNETHAFVESHVFKKVFNIYSTGDYIQIFDVISTQDNYSQRRFSYNSELPKLIQMEIEVNDVKPHHNELWFFCHENNFLYRKSFPLKPNPVSVFAPAITCCLDAFSSKACDLLLRIRLKDRGLKLNFYDRITKGRIKTVFF
jgi:hypothetical protein